MDLVTSNFDNVIVVYNGANTMEMGWTEDYEQIKSVLLCAGPGATGFNALGQIIAGEVNPSGRTVDIWPADLTAAPWYNNIGHFNYTDPDSQAIAAAQEVWPRADGYVTFVDYVESIYVGYKFYETAYADGMAGFDYDSAVMYPFGYGLPFTTFDQSLDSVAVSGTTVTAQVTVTNTGAAAGKDVVQLYYNPPYTDGGIEKAAVNLIICTGDQEFMDKYGYELMLDCAKFRSSRLEPGADGQLHINDVVGPDCTEYDERIEQVNAAMTGLLARKGELEREDRTVPAQDRRILATTDTLEEASEIREGFNDALVYQTVSSIKVLDKDRLQVRFKDGTEVEQAIEHVGRQASA